MLQDKDITEKERRTAKIRAKTTNAARMKKIQIFSREVTGRKEKRNGREVRRSTEHTTL